MLTYGHGRGFVSEISCSVEFSIWSEIFGGVMTVPGKEHILIKVAVFQSYGHVLKFTLQQSVVAANGFEIMTHIA